ncbi:MAG TPA: TlpA disulfide reductase family protein [Candidatus Polarisedimenticolaceae bacterium]|nr:TlpA disulfide reductase family protein [Candidatus Polarisedimenticolaceae bacterium]
MFPGNPEPYVGRALLAAGRKDEKAALAHLQEAVLRGFTDFPRLERSEQWRRLRRNATFLGLIDTVPRLQEIERAWPAWNEVRSDTAPKDVQTALAERAAVDASIDRMAPALGPRLATVWHRATARATAARFERYVDLRGDAPDAGEAVRHLFALYAGEGGIRWEVLPAAEARKFADVAALARKHVPGRQTEEGALAITALAWNAQRNWKGVLDPKAPEPLLASLDRLMADHPTSPFLPLAAEGSVRTEVERGRMDLATARYRKFRQDHAADPALLQEVRERLGVVALSVGGLPSFQATALDGASLDDAALRGKVAVFDFWATWCGPCVKEMPTLRRIAERHGDQVMLVGVSLDGAEDLSADELRAWTARENVPGKQLHDGRGWESALVRDFGVQEIPFTVVIGRDGAVRSIGQRGKDLERAVEEALNRPAAAR